MLVHYPLYLNAEAIYPSRIFFKSFSEYKKRYLHYWWRHYDEFRFYRAVDTSCITSTILTGDAMIDAVMARYIQKALNGRKSLVLQVPHHGSRDNWKAVQDNNIEADINIIPVGYGNRHKHPHKETIDSLIKNNKTFYCVTQSKSFIYSID